MPSRAKAWSVGVSDSGSAGVNIACKAAEAPPRGFGHRTCRWDFRIWTFQQLPAVSDARMMWRRTDATRACHAVPRSLSLCKTCQGLSRTSGLPTSAVGRGWGAVGESGWHLGSSILHLTCHPFQEAPREEMHKKVKSWEEEAT